jgi:transposase
MLTVDKYARIRQAHRDGMSIRAIARTFHHSRRKVRDVLNNPEPKPYTRLGEPPASKLGGFYQVIQQILSDDEQAPPKQRHTCQRIFERLRDEHSYEGGYDAVRRYVGKTQRRYVETFIPLSHDPGQRLEADFGHIYVDFPDGRKQIPVLALVWSHSNYPLAIALPSERTEAILEGMVQGFEFFGCVPREVWWAIPRRWRRRSSAVGNGSCIRVTRLWPAIMCSSRCFVCQDAATRSRTSRIASKRCKGVGPHRCRGRRTWPTSMSTYVRAV